MGNSGGKDGSAAVNPEVKTFVDTKIAGKAVVVFSKSYCPYCTRSKKMLKEHVPDDVSDDDIDIIEIDDREDCDAIQKYLKSLTGASSVPRIFVHGTSIGGNDDLTKIHQNGKLSGMLKEKA